MALTTFPRFIDEVAFASNPFDTPQIYTILHDDQTLKRTRKRTWKRGRQTESEQPDTGSSRLEFENLDRALDAENAASIYYPNVLPMRRTRSRVARANASDATLTTSGNEVTDATRAAASLLGTGASGNMCDGLTNDSSFGIRRAATNLFRRGQCDAVTDWAGASGGTVIAVDATVLPPFSTQSIKTTTDASLASQGVIPQTATGQAAAAGVVAVGSVWFKGVAGQSYFSQLRWRNTDATVTDGANVTFNATGAWQLLTPPSLAVAVGKTGDQLLIMARINGTRAESFWTAHAMLEKGQSVVAPYVATSGGATATHAAGRVQAPVALVDETQGGIAIRVRMGYACDAALTQNNVFFNWADTANERLVFDYVRAPTKQWRLARVNGGTFQAVTSAVQTFLAGDFLTLIIAWEAGRVRISVNGGAFVSAAAVLTPTLAATLFDIGSAGSGALVADSDFLWAIPFTGTLTDADAATIHAFGNTDPGDPTFANFPESWLVTATIPFVTSTYRVPGDAFCFTTFVDPEYGWQLDQGETGSSFAIAQAKDGFDLLSTANFTAFDSLVQQTPGARINAILDKFNWPAGERAIDVSAEQQPIQAVAVGSLKGLSALDLIQQAAETEDGVFFVDGRGYAVFHDRYHKLKSTRSTTSQATFCDHDNYATGFFFYKQLAPSTSRIVNNMLVTRAGGTEQEATDPTSITTYRRRSRSLSTQHLTDAEAAAFGNYKISGTKDPQRRYDEMVLEPGDDVGLWLQILNREIGDRITVIQSPTGGGAPVVRDMYIEAIDVTVGPGVTAEARLRLSPASAVRGWVMSDVQYSLLGTSTHMVA